MRKLNKKVLSVFACTSALATVVIVANQNDSILSPMTTIVNADTTSVPAKSYGVDVSNWQSSNLNADAQSGARFAIVELSEGTSYRHNFRNLSASDQIASAKANNIMPMAYHFATFGGNSNEAKTEANYAINTARAAGVPKGTYLACDWEKGEGNVITGSVASNTAAISTFMSTVQNAGYQPMLYSFYYALRDNINTVAITNQFPNSIWAANFKYKSGVRMDSPDFNYFPSIDGVSIWQFTDNWHGLNVDGNINMLPLSIKSVSQPPKKVITEGIYVDSGSKVATIAHTGNIALWKTPNGAVTGRYLTNGSRWKVSGKTQVNNEWWYNLGGNQWVPGKYLYVTGFSAIPLINIVNPTNPTEPTVMAKVGRVNYVPGYGIMIWQDSSYNTPLKRYLPHGSRWKVFKKTNTSDGRTWYNLGGNQWIDGQYLIIE